MVFTINELLLFVTQTDLGVDLTERRRIILRTLNSRQYWNIDTVAVLNSWELRAVLGMNNDLVQLFKSKHVELLQGTQNQEHFPMGDFLGLFFTEEATLQRMKANYERQRGRSDLQPFTNILRQVLLEGTPGFVLSPNTMFVAGPK